MHPFTLERPRDLAAALAPRAQAGRNDAPAEYIAGGTDMVQLLQEYVRRPQKRAKFGLALPALPGGEQRGAALARKIRAVCFEAFDDPAASGLYPAAIGPKIRPAGAAQQPRL